MKSEEETASTGLIINEVQLILAEKRTSLAAMRTGIAVFVLPVSVLSVLIATSKHYDLEKVVLLIAPLLILCAGLVVLGTFLTHRSMRKILRYDAMIRKLKEKNSAIAKFIE